MSDDKNISEEELKAIVRKAGALYFDAMINGVAEHLIQKMIFEFADNAVDELRRPALAEMLADVSVE